MQQVLPVEVPTDETHAGAPGGEELQVYGVRESVQDSGESKGNIENIMIHILQL